jgi:hypothetical protein
MLNMARIMNPIRIMFDFFNTRYIGKKEKNLLKNLLNFKAWIRSMIFERVT